MSEFKEESKLTNDLKDIGALVIVTTISASLIFLLMFFTGGASELPEAFNKVSLYAYLLSIALVGIVGLKIYSYASKKQDKSTMFDVLINDPENGLTFITKIKYFRGWYLAFFSILFFSLIGFLASSINQSLFLIVAPNVQQQVSTIANIIFNVEPAVSAETHTFILYLSLVYFPVMYLLGINKKNQNNSLKLLIIIIVSLIMGLTWMGYHSVVYGADQTSLLSTFIFGTAGSFISMATGTFFVWWIWHYMNNLFFRIFILSKSGLLGNQWITLTFIIIWSLTLFIGVGIMLLKNRKGAKS